MAQPAAQAEHYAILELQFGASLEDVKKAHRRLALKWHPDKVADPSDEVAVGVATQQFQLLQAAYEILSDPEKRLRYDEKCRATQARSADVGAAPWKRARTTFRPSWGGGEKKTLNVPADAATIGLAVAMLPVAGGIIRVEPGTYVGIVVVSKPFVEIVGAAAVPGRTLVQGQVVFRECARGARVQGLTVRAACKAGALDFRNVRGSVSIEDCDVSNSVSAGVIFEGCTGDFTMSHCTVHGCKYDGLGLHHIEEESEHSGSLSVHDCRFEGNGYDGLYLGDPRFRVKLLRTRVTGNRRHGIFLRGTELDQQESQLEGNGQEAVHREAFVQRAKPRDPAPKPRARELDPSGLPEGWRAFQTAEGLTYYYHVRTATTTWVHPCQEAEQGAAATDAAGQLTGQA